jgi:uncharacterized protein (TIGR00369 family)
VTGPAKGLLECTCRSAHPRCIVCGRDDGYGLGLRFSLRADGGVEAEFACDTHFQGYHGILHGGIIATLLDGAMTHCLFAHGIVALTAEMTVRFRHPVLVGVPALVRAVVADSQPPLHVLHALIFQDGQLKARAVGKFVERRADARVKEVTASKPSRGRWAEPST